MKTEVQFVCPRSHQMLPLCNETKCCRRTGQSKQPQLWPKVCHTDLVSKTIFIFRFWALRTHHISPALPWSSHTCPNQLSGDENAGFGLDWEQVPGLRGLVDSARETAVIQLHKRHAQVCDISLFHWAFSVHPSSFSLLHTEKCKSASGWSEGIGPLFQKWSEIPRQIEFKFSA